jgi:hypothetical protein
MGRGFSSVALRTRSRLSVLQHSQRQHGDCRAEQSDSVGFVVITPGRIRHPVPSGISRRGRGLPRLYYNSTVFPGGSRLLAWMHRAGCWVEFHCDDREDHGNAGGPS